MNWIIRAIFIQNGLYYHQILDCQQSDHLFIVSIYKKMLPSILFFEIHLSLEKSNLNVLTGTTFDDEVGMYWGLLLFKFNGKTNRKLVIVFSYTLLDSFLLS